jgi:hypothetical protein
MPAEIRQAPGWWPSLVHVVCRDCGHRGPVRDLNDRPAMAQVLVKLERQRHRCGYADDENVGSNA